MNAVKNFKLDRKHLLIIAGLVIVVFIYMRYRSGSSSSSTTPQSSDTTGTADPGSSGYADLAGQLQGQAAQESNDVASLGGAETTDAQNISALQGLEGNDASNIGLINAAESQDAGNIANLHSSQAAQSKRADNIIKSLNVLKRTVSGDNRKIAQQHKEIVKLQAGKGSPKGTTRTKSHGASKGGKTARAAVGHANRGHVRNPPPPPRHNTRR